MNIKKTVTPSVRERNKKNSQKSTGPSSAQGKAVARFNALTHGLTSRYLLSTAEEAAANPELSPLIEDLRARYGAGDIVIEILIDSIAADFWRQKQGLEAEKRLYAEVNWVFGPQGSMPNLHRYNTANRRALLKNIELLDKLTASQGSTETPESEEEDELQGALISLQDGTVSGGNESVQTSKEQPQNGEVDESRAKTDDGVEHGGDGGQADAPVMPLSATTQNVPATIGEADEATAA